MLDNSYNLFNNFCETVERYGLISETERLIFCFSGGKDASVGLYFLQKYLNNTNRIRAKLCVLMVLFPKHVYFDENNEHDQLDTVIKYWESLGIHIDILRVSREDIVSSTCNPCKFCKNARKRNRQISKRKRIWECLQYISDRIHSV